MTREERGRTLAPRQREIAAHLVAGRSVREIAFELDLHDCTVKTVAKTIYRKVGLHGDRNGKRELLWHRMQELGL